jgi:glutamyl-tRNA synthetase
MSAISARHSITGCGRAKAEGRFLLRLDDTDLARSTEEFADAIRTDLAWLGLVPDDIVRQSERFDLYERRFQELRATGRVYPAYETAQELDLKRKILAGRGLPPIYDRAALRLCDEDRARHSRPKELPRTGAFKLDHDAMIEWDDLVRGAQHLDPKLQSDPVIRRADGSWLYMLPSVIDDIDMGVTHIVRGEDHVTNTGLQLQMFAALGAPAPAFAHEALLVGSEGKLSKRLGSLGCDTFREEGIEPLALAALLARIGTSDPVEPVADTAPLIESIDFARFGRAPARFDLDELKALNARTIHLMEFAIVATRLPEGMDARIWQVVRPEHLDDIRGCRLAPGDCRRNQQPPHSSRTIRPISPWPPKPPPTMSWGEEAWQTLTAALKERSGRKGRGLFLPLRQALTARDHGPDMAALLPLIGRERIDRPAGGGRSLSRF